MPRREQTSFSTSSIFRALGVRSRRQLPLATVEAQPVVIISDLSSSYAPEAIEARAVVAFEALGNSTSINLQLFSKAQGGCIIEYLGIASNLAGTQAQVEVRDTSAVSSALNSIINVGGIATESVPTSGMGVAISPPRLIYPTPWVSPTDRMFIPAGSFLHCASVVPGGPAVQNAYFIMVWREIPEILGGP